MCFQGSTWEWKPKHLPCKGWPTDLLSPCVRGFLAPTASTVPPPSNNLPLVWICRSNDLKATLCQRCLIKLVMRCSKFGSCAEEKQMLFQHQEKPEWGLTQFAVRNWTRSQVLVGYNGFNCACARESHFRQSLRAPLSGRKYTKQVLDMNLLGNVRVLPGACWPRQPDRLIPCRLHELCLEKSFWWGKFSSYKQRVKS